MKEFDSLLKIAEILNSPEGCPWDRKQTFASLRPYVLEEAHEVLEAIDSDEDAAIIEELGDLFYTVIFYAKVAEKEKRFSIKEIIKALEAKLIRRHPHVFGEKKAKSMEDVIKNWEKAKSEEKKERKSALDGIPKTLPSLLRAQKILGRIKKNGIGKSEKIAQTEEEILAKQILDIVHKANDSEIDIESAFRVALSQEEARFRSVELYP